MHERRSAPRQVNGPEWAGRLALLFVLVSLGVLSVVPALLQRRLAPLREQAGAADEARTLVTRVQFSLASQMSALRGARITPDSAHLAVYAQAVALERSAYPPLDSLTAQLSDSTRATVRQLRNLSARWHASVNVRGVPRLEGGVLGGPGLRLYEEVLAQARRLDAAMAASAARRRAEIRRAEDREDALTAVMSVAALLAAGVLGWIGQRMRALVHEAAARENEAERALEAARRMARSRERLMRGVTHDLKNPLGAADGYTQLLREGLEGELSAGQKAMLDSIRRCNASALGLVTELLDLARAEKGTLGVSRGPADGVEIARAAAEEYGGAARAAGHAFDLVVPAGALPCTTDPARALRVVANLLSNAVKYTPAPGRIQLEARAGAHGGGPGKGPWIELRVGDNGPGIPAHERERIFDEFHRLHDAEEGHGLGLATSRRIARLMGGDITVGTAEGGGAVFTLWLPGRPGTAMETESGAGARDGAGAEGGRESEPPSPPRDALLSVAPVA